MLLLGRTVVDVLVYDLIDGSVFLELCKSLVDLLKKLGVFLCYADGVVLDCVLIVTFKNVDTLISLNEGLGGLVIDDNAINLA